MKGGVLRQASADAEHAKEFAGARSASSYDVDRHMPRQETCW